MPILSIAVNEEAASRGTERVLAILEYLEALIKESLPARSHGHFHFPLILWVGLQKRCAIVVGSTGGKMTVGLSSQTGWLI